MFLCGIGFEVAFLLAAFHRRFAGLVVHPRGAALGNLGHGRLGDDLDRRGRGAGHGAGAADVAHGAEADRQHLADVAVLLGRDRRHGHQQAVLAHHFALVRIVDRRQRQVLAGDVLPHVQFRPVRDREHAHLLAGGHAGVVQAPQLGALGLRVPLAELVAEREDPLLGARLFLVAAGAAHQRVELVRLDGFQQRHGLRGVARIGFLAQPHGAALDGVLDMAHHQPRAQFRHALVAEGDDLWVVVAGVDVDQRERQLHLAVAQAERLQRQVQHDDRVLAAREQQRRVAALGHHLADDVDRLGFQPVEVVVLDLQQVFHVGGHACVCDVVHDAHVVIGLW